MTKRAEILDCLWAKPLVDGRFLSLDQVRGSAPFFGRRRWDLMQRRLIDAELFVWQNHVTLEDEGVRYAMNGFLVTGEPLWLDTVRRHMDLTYVRQMALAGFPHTVNTDLQQQTKELA